jgi:DNA ligase D-like protein (predicted 3'-phosphoesterase)
MSLDKYQKKRDFKKTPEPTGKKPAKPDNQLIFVIQKHDATNLHYDLRLEIDGVLKSWAVPKQPSADSTVKRLAIQVEDHPLSYADFEAVIPEGEYGAGKVAIWDKGEYQNLRQAKENMSMLDSWKDGKIEIQLQGKKLKGKYVLIQTKREQGKHWLFFKIKST